MRTISGRRDVTIYQGDDYVAVHFGGDDDHWYVSVLRDGALVYLNHGAGRVEAIRRGLEDPEP